MTRLIPSVFIADTAATVSPAHPVAEIRAASPSHRPSQSVLQARRFVDLALHGLEKLVQTQVVIATCAVALALESSQVAGTRFQPTSFYAFLFFGTLSSYWIHGCVARSLAGSSIPRASISFAVTLSLATGVLALQLSAIQLGLASLAAGVAWLYSVPIRRGARRLRDHGTLKILALTGTWTLMTVVLPLIGLADTKTMVLIAVRRFLFMFALCVTFDLRDVSTDALNGVRTLAVQAGEAGTYRLVAIVLILFCAASVFGSSTHTRVSAALMISALATWCVIRQTRRRRSHLLYLVGIDGMMLVQPLLVCSIS